MIKKTITIILLLLLTGCGVTEDGSDGSSGATGTDGRDFQTPVLRPYTWDGTHILATFSDVTSTDLKLSFVMFGVGNNNAINIYVPANSGGKKLRAIINGVQSCEIVVPSNESNNITFSTYSGTDSNSVCFMNCLPLDITDNTSYFSWYLDGVEQEFYFSDSFE